MNRAGRFFLMQFVIIIALLCCQTILTVQAQITPWGKKSKAIELAQMSMLKVMKEVTNIYGQRAKYAYDYLAKTIIENEIAAEKADIKVYGWKAENVEGQKFLVTYSYTRKENNTNICWAFEVLINDGVTRYIFSSKELMKTYGEDIARLAFGDENTKILYWVEQKE